MRTKPPILLWMGVATICVFAGFGLHSQTVGDPVLLRGSIMAEDGAPFSATNVDISLVVSGERLFKENEDCAASRVHMAGMLRKEVGTGLGGQFSLQFNMGDFEAVKEVGCYSQGLELASVDSIAIRVEAQNTYQNCNIYCRGHNLESVSSCLHNCTAAGQVILGSRVLAREEIERLREVTGGYDVLANLAIVVDHIGIRLDQRVEIGQ